MALMIISAGEVAFSTLDQHDKPGGPEHYNGPIYLSTQGPNPPTRDNWVCYKAHQMLGPGPSPMKLI